MTIPRTIVVSLMACGLLCSCAAGRQDYKFVRPAFAAKPQVQDCSVAKAGQAEAAGVANKCVTLLVADLVQVLDQLEKSCRALGEPPATCELLEGN